MRVIYNGIDVEAWHPVDDPDVLAELGIDPSRPSVVFVGRITRQKGLPYFLRAAELLPPEVQVVLCAGAPDTPQILAEVGGLVRALQETRDGVVWIDRMLPRHELCAILTRGDDVRVPLGLRAAGHREPRGDGVRRGRGRHRDRRHPRGRRRRGDRPARADRAGAGRHGHARRSRALRRRSRPRAHRGRRCDPERARAYGEAGRERAADDFSWGAIADATTRALRGGRGHRPIGWTHAAGARVLRCRRPPKRPGHRRSRWTGRSTDDQRWVILGPNGAGKTTLLQLADTLAAPHLRLVTILGERLGRTDVFELRPRIGFASSAMAKRVPPRGDACSTSCSPPPTRCSAAGTRTTRTSTSAARCGCWRSGASTTSPTARSARCRDGEQKRVQIARAVMTDPELLLLDEPTASLDLGAREELLMLLGGYAQSPTTPAMVMVTHHVEEIPVGFTHVLLLRDGAVVAAGPLARDAHSREPDRDVRHADHADRDGRPLRRTRRALSRFRARAAGLIESILGALAPQTSIALAKSRAPISKESP